MTGGPALIRTRAATVRAAMMPDWLSAAVPEWLADVVRPKPVRPPWPAMIRAALAICVPLSVAFIVGKATLGVLPAIGGLFGTLVDTGGSYLGRVKRVSSAAVFGGAVGLTIGSVIHGHGWLAVVALVVVAGASGVLSAISDIGSATGLQLLVYATLATGPLGALRPVWHTAVGFLAGVVWALILIVPGWLLAPHGSEQRAVADVYHALAAMLGSVGRGDGATGRRAVTAAATAAYDTVLTARALLSGQNRQSMRLIAALNAANLMAEAATALAVAGQRPPPLVIATVERLADSVRNGTPPPPIPPPWSASPGARTLRDAMASAARVLSRDWSPERPPGQWAPEERPRDEWPSGERPRGERPRGERQGRVRLAGSGRRVREAVGRLAGEFDAGTLNRLFTIRLMACIGAAAVVSEVLPLQRSYWVPLTVAIVLKPDQGSVFARALQRGIGTIVGAVAGAVLLALVHGTWLLIPFAVLAGLLPYGRARNYGLMATFLTPLVVVLIDLLSPGGWRLAEDRLIDTLIGCAIVLLVGYAPWPTSWHAHLPRQFAVAVANVCSYMEEALLRPGQAGAAADVTELQRRSQMRQSTYRALADLRTEFQRTMSEPPSISRRASAWLPALVALEQVMDAITSVAVAIDQGVPSPGGLGGASPPARTVPPAGVRQLCAALRAVSQAVATGTAVPAPPELPDDETLEPVTRAVRSLLGVLGSNEPVSRPTGRAGRI
jgi:uncharacterized membrane protein YccC